MSGIDFGSVRAYINAENYRCITTCKAYGRVTQLKRQLENKCIADERQSNRAYRQETPPEPQCIGLPKTVYFLQGAIKTAENRGKKWQKYAV